VCDRLTAAWISVRASAQAVHGVDVRPGTTTDFVILNVDGPRQRGLLQAMAHPELADLNVVNLLRQGEVKDTPLLLLSETECFEVESDRSSVSLRRVVESSPDFFGCVADYLRERFGEGIRGLRPLRLTKRTSPPSSVDTFDSHN
jgi:hypothetical protein